MSKQINSGKLYINNKLDKIIEKHIYKNQTNISSKVLLPDVFPSLQVS